MTNAQPRPLSEILIELSQALGNLAASATPSVDLTAELDLARFARNSGVEAQMFRAIELLVLSAHAAGLTTRQDLQHMPVYREAVLILRMSGRSLPEDLPC